MQIYGAFVWPFLTGLILFFYARNRTEWWEYFTPFAVCLFLICGSKVAVEKSQTSDTEYWGDKAVTATYNEYWEEEVPCTHEKECTRSDGKGGTETYGCGDEHLYDVEKHQPEWFINDSQGHRHDISPEYFNYLCKHWSNRQFVELNHTSVHMERDGDRYVTNWGGQRETLVPVITKHTYENRVVASNSVFKFKEVTPAEVKQYGLYEYPAIDGNYQSEAILGEAGDQKNVGEKEFNYLNATLGPSHQVRLQVLIFKDKPVQAGYLQQAYWQGGNKNEFVVCIGVNKRQEIQWAYPFCWKPDAPVDKDSMNMLSIQTRDYLQDKRGKRLNLKDLAARLEKEIPLKWRRKKFQEFNYLNVDPPTSAVIFVNILVILTCIGIAYWVATNDFTEDAPTKVRRRIGRYR